MSAPAELGECLVAELRAPDGSTRIRIDRADPRIIISTTLLDVLAEASHRDVILSPDTIQIDGVNRSVTYSLGEHVHDGKYRIATRTDLR